jgi:hypothetical protein
VGWEWMSVFIFTKVWFNQPNYIFIYQHGVAVSSRESH